MKKNTEPTIGVVAISKNEEVDMPHFLRHLVDWVDEIIIVDDGSTDSTKEIVLSFGPKVKLVEQKMDLKNGGFARQRNRGIQEATSEWLLHMDIDERITPSFAREVKVAIQNTKFNAYRYRRLNFFLNRPMKGGGLQDWNNPQLARRGFHRFENSVHETCAIDGIPLRIGQLNGQMWHLNDESYLERMTKSMVYCQNQAIRLVKSGKRIKWHHLLLIPLSEFFYKFFWKAGFKDGVVGLLWSLHASSSMFRACSIVWDEQNRLSRYSIENKIQNMINNSK